MRQRCIILAAPFDVIAPASNPVSLSCPVPLLHRAEITVGHGGGGRLTQDLIHRIFRPAFAHPALTAAHDGAVLPVGGLKLAFTTDAHVVSPLFFLGGDIGTLAVHGTVNDLAMCGALPLWLSLPTATLERVVASMRRAAPAAGVAIVTNDTKVVEHGKGDGLYITTSGVGVVQHPLTIAHDSVRPGDAVIVSGDIGRHGHGGHGQSRRPPIRERDRKRLLPACRAGGGPPQSPPGNPVRGRCIAGLPACGIQRALILIAKDSEKGRDFWLSQGFEEISGGIPFGRDLA